MSQAISPVRGDTRTAMKRLYEAIAATGIDVEAASDRSLEQNLMMPLGHAFQVGAQS